MGPIQCGRGANVYKAGPAMRTLLPLLALLLVEFPVVSTATPHEPGPRPSVRSKENLEVKLDLLQRVYGALRKGVDFFASDYSAINVDGVFGIRLAEGSVDGILTECQTDQLACPLDLVRRLEELQHKIDHTSDMAMPYLEAQDPVYLSHFHAAIDRKYVLDYRPEYLGHGRKVEPSGIEYNEDKGDACLDLILGAGQIDNKPQPKCTITEECWNFMTVPDLDDYSITHQLLYFIFLDKTDCEEQARPFASKEDPEFLRGIERKFCRNILGEAQSLFKDGNVRMMKQDLFLEQTVLCGMLGFEDFFADEYIRAVLAWQLPSGCFTLSPGYMKKAMDVEEQRLQRSKLLEALQEEAAAIEQSPRVTGRKLLRETRMEGGCLSHKTGLALGTLAAYLRFLVEQVYSTTAQSV